MNMHDVASDDHSHGSDHLLEGEELRFSLSGDSQFLCYPKWGNPTEDVMERYKDAIIPAGRVPLHLFPHIFPSGTRVTEDVFLVAPAILVTTPTGGKMLMPATVLH